MAATEKELTRISERVGHGTLHGAEIGKTVGKISGKYKVDKHFHTTITDTGFTFERNQARIAADTLDAAGVVQGYKKLANIERDFPFIQTDDLDLRPIYHRLDQRVRTHVLICLLAGYLIWHLRKAWAPLTYTHQHPPARDNPVAAAQRSPQATAKAAHKHDANGNPLRSFRGLLDHLATLTRDSIRYHDTNIEIDKLTEPTPDQRRAFDLIDTTIPLTIAA